MSPETVDLGGPGIVLNLAGEGEMENAIDINSLRFPLLSPERWARPGRFLRGDVRALPIRDRVASEVVGRKLPMFTGADRSAIVREAVRVLVPGGVLRLHASSGGGPLWLPFLKAHGLRDSTIEGIYARGIKPR